MMLLFLLFCAGKMFQGVRRLFGGGARTSLDAADAAPDTDIKAKLAAAEREAEEAECSAKLAALQARTLAAREQQAAIESAIAVLATAVPATAEPHVRRLLVEDLQAE
jgi:hypothetical protein